MAVPKAITETLKTLREERGPLAARLDAIDLAIDNLSRVYGINGAAQPLPFKVHRASAVKETNGTEAATRRDLLFTVIAKSEVGLTLAELRKATPKMDGKDRSNALQILKADGKIQRKGNAWQVA